MEYNTREYPLFSVCGLNCGLCPRFYTDGESKCPGCAGSGFSAVHPPCGVLSCCQRKELAYCYECDDFPCKKYDNADMYDSVITHKNQFRDLEKAKQSGIDSYKAELDEKTAILAELLQNYDDGRRKSFFCNTINLLDLDSIRSVMRQLADAAGTEGVSGKASSNKEVQKAKAESAVGLFSEIAEVKGISLKLRKK
jgi:hypothetical protein